MYLTIKTAGFCKDIIPMVLFCIGWILINLLILSIIISDNKKSLSCIAENLRIVLYVITVVLAFIAILLVPLKETYYCKGNICKATTFSLITTSNPYNVIINNDTESIGMNTNPIDDSIAHTDSALFINALNDVCYVVDRNNLEKFKNAKGEKVKLFSISGLGIAGFFIILCVIFSLTVGKAGWIILALLLSRLLYVLFFV